MRKTILTILLAAATMAAGAKSWLADVEYTARLGYSIGGTTPVGMPATIRSLNHYTPKANLALGVDAHKRLTSLQGVLTGAPQWGILAGLHYERKAMEVDATVKNYSMMMTKGGDEIEGYYTGNLVTECDEWVLTIPVLATLSLGEKVMLKCGPYLSYVASRAFEGYVYDGYLRRVTPTGEKIEMGNTDDTRGTFDFSGEMRRLQAGLDLGADWQIGSRWGAFADLKWGLSGIHRSSFKTIEQTLYPIYGTLGVTYKLK
ncbi:MAG: PorT family protein [Prevotella sp.]|nr:PorT family protein [Prevotella sp.]